MVQHSHRTAARRRVIEDIEDEMRLHVELETETNIERGMGPDEARRAALKGFGKVGKIKDLAYDVRGGGMLETLWQDLRYGARMLLKNPGFTLIGVSTLALGIGANTAISGVVHAVLLRPLPFKDPERVVFISETSERVPVMAVSVPDFIDWREHNNVFEQIVAFRGQNYTLTGVTGVEGPERIEGLQVTEDYFSLFGVSPALGRIFTSDEDRPGGERVALLGYNLWRDRFGGDRSITGQRLTLDGDPFTIIGVLPKEFSVPNQIVDVCTSLGRVSDRLNFRAFHFGTFVYARLKPGVTLSAARGEMNGVATYLQEQFPRSNKGIGISVEPLNQWIVRETKSTLWILWEAVGLVLLIVCANVANLLLARASGRQEEIAIRMAIGAGRARIIRQLLTENILLAVCGSTIGLLVGYLGMNGLRTILPENTPRLEDVRIDTWVLAFSAGVAVLTGLLFGIVPALRMARADVNESLKELGRGTVGGHARVRRALVVAEVALSLILLISAGLTFKSFMRMLHADLGFDPENVVSVEISLPDRAYSDAQKRSTFMSQLTDNVSKLSGVYAAANTSLLPLAGGPSTVTFAIEGRDPLPPDQEPTADIIWISPEYFRAMQINLLKGRYFNDQDAENSRPVIIVDETLAQTYWPGEDPSGKRIEPRMPGLRDPRFTVVGVVKHVKNYGVDQASRFEVYIPYAQDPRGSLFYLVLRTKGTAAGITSDIRSEVNRLDSTLPIYNVKTMEQYVGGHLGQRRLSMILLSVFAAVALVLAAVGIYGVLSYSVTQRTHEIGVRMALGAKASDLLKSVVREGLMMALTGMALGLVAALALTRVLSSVLFEVSATDPITFFGLPLFLVLISLVACYVPARRATKIDPMVALRYE